MSLARASRGRSPRPPRGRPNDRVVVLVVVGGSSPEDGSFLFPLPSLSLGVGASCRRDRGLPSPAAAAPCPPALAKPEGRRRGIGGGGGDRGAVTHGGIPILGASVGDGRLEGREGFFP